MASHVASSIQFNVSDDEPMKVSSFDSGDTRFVAITVDHTNTATFAGDPSDLIDLFKRAILAAQEATKDLPSEAATKEGADA
jgi:hypothetical protein